MHRMTKCATCNFRPSRNSMRTRPDRPAPFGFKTEIRRIEDCMTAQLFDLDAERARRAARLPKVMPSAAPQWRLSQRGNPYTTVDGYHLVVFKRRLLGLSDRADRH